MHALPTSHPLLPCLSPSPAPWGAQSCPTVDGSCQAPLSMGFSRKNRSGLPCPPPGDLPNQGWTSVPYASCFHRRVLYRWRSLGNPWHPLMWLKIDIQRALCGSIGGIARCRAARHLKRGGFGKKKKKWVVNCAACDYLCLEAIPVVCSRFIMLAGSVVPDSLRPHGLQPARLLCPRPSPVKNTGVG